MMRAPLVDLLAQSAPPESTREGRIRLLLAATAALRDGRRVPRDAACFLATALCNWLEEGGSLERDHLRVSAKAGSHVTPRRIALQLQTRTVTDGTAAGKTLRFPSSRGTQES
jgi:hypothetical protein